MPPFAFITSTKRSAKPNTTCSGGFAAPSVAAYMPQTVPERPATAAPPQNPYFSSSRTRTPALAAVNAAATPAAPPPTTSTSVSRVRCPRWSLASAIFYSNSYSDILQKLDSGCQQWGITTQNKPLLADSLLLLPLARKFTTGDMLLRYCAADRCRSK